MIDAFQKLFGPFLDIHRRISIGLGILMIMMPSEAMLDHLRYFT